MKKRWAITILAVLLAALLIWVFIINGSKAVYEKPLVPVRIAKAQRSTVEESLRLTGYVEAQSMIPVVPFVSGTITEYLSKEGDYVEKDSVMAVIDTQPYSLQVSQAEAVYTATLATYERVSNLYQSGAATKQQFDEVKAQLDAYKAQLDLANLQLGYCSVKAPVSGTVLISASAEGSVAAQGNYIFIMADITKLKVTLDVPEKYFDVFNAKAEELRAFVSREGKTTQAVVSSVAPYVSPQSKTFKVTLELSDAEGFVPGMFVNADVVYNTLENVLVLDWKTRNNDGTVYAYNPETETAVCLTPQVLASGESVFAIDDSYADTWFITDGQSSVMDGRKVKVVE